MVLPYQQRFVDKVLDYSLQYDHVLYRMDNETRAGEEWGRYWAIYLKGRAERENRKIFVTEMWDDWDIMAERHKLTFDYPELYDFVDVSQNNHRSGQTHWDQGLRVRDYLARHPRPINMIKTYGAPDNRLGQDQDRIERFWRHLLAGVAAIHFHRPHGGLGLNDQAVASIRGARKLESQIPLWTLEPANDLLSDRQPNHAYLSAGKGRTFALYLPVGGSCVSICPARMSHWSFAGSTFPRVCGLRTPRLRWRHGFADFPGEAQLGGGDHRAKSCAGGRHTLIENDLS